MDSLIPIQALTLESAAFKFIILGFMLVMSILIDILARRTGLPRISFLVLLGVLFAVFHQNVMDFKNTSPLGDLTDPLINLALVMVAFLLGGDLYLDRLKSTGRMIFIISLSVLFLGAITVGIGLALLGFSIVTVIALAAISVATAPAAVRAVVKEKYGDKKKYTLTAEVLLGIVAIDDAYGIISFALAIATIGWVTASNGAQVLMTAVWELGGALAIGAFIGIPAAKLTGRLCPGEPTQVEAFAVVLLLVGITSWLNVSSLLAAMFAGFLVANLSSHHTRSLRKIENIEWPFMVFFFVLSGASIDLSYVNKAVGVMAAFIVLRLIGRLIGGWFGVLLLGKNKTGQISKSIGFALTPQAGVAMGMALLISERYPESGTLIVAVVVASTVFFELIGPILTKWVLDKSKNYEH